MTDKEIKEMFKEFPKFRKEWKKITSNDIESQRELNAEMYRYRKLQEMEERKANLPESEFTKAKRAERTSEVTSEATSEINDLEMAAVEYFKEALNTGNDSKLDWFKAGANWRKQQMINKGAEWLRKALDNGMWVDQFLSEKDKEAIVFTYKENMEEEFKL